MRIAPLHRPLRSRGVGIARRAEALGSANILRGAGLRSAARVVERDAARRTRLGR
ncbi:MAG TPA: hypothetical protein VLN26_19415 [Gaiellaceae bacterium]|nr:hypothetical protein [Gaiellaceae bacterium]